MSKESPHIACPKCVSITATKSVSFGQETADEHNNQQHDANDIAGVVDVRSNDEMKRFVSQVKELAPGDKYENFVNKMHKGNASFFCPASMYREIVPEEDRGIGGFA